MPCLLPSNGSRWKTCQSYASSRSGLVSGSFPLIHEEHIEDSVNSARLADLGLLEHRLQVQCLEERKNMHRRNNFRTRQDRGVNMRTSCRFDTHMNKGGLSAPEQESVRTCLRSGEPLTVCFLSPTKRLRAIMAILNLTDLPQDWRILDLSQECCEASLTFDELVKIAREHESGLADNKESAIEGVRLLLRSLVRSGLLQCCTHISTEDPESSVETYRLNQFKDPSDILENQPDMKAHAEKMKEILSSKQTEPLESVIEIMQHSKCLEQLPHFLGIRSSILSGFVEHLGRLWTHFQPRPGCQSIARAAKTAERCED